jgi:Zn finger protein HypA/HybF involved in hydrogenase expression
VSSPTPLHRTLEQELQALLRGVSLECLVCGEFVMHAGGMLTCPECNSSVRAAADSEKTRLQFDVQAG